MVANRSAFPCPWGDPLTQATERLHRWAAHRVWDTHAREDLVQRVLLIWWSYIQNGGRIVNLEAWLYTTLQHEICRHFRRQRQWCQPDPESLEALTAREPEEPEDPDPRIGRLRQVLATACDNFGYQVLRLRLENLTFDEIAVRLGRTSTACRVAAHRARHRLQAILSQA